MNKHSWVTKSGPSVESLLYQHDGATWVFKINSWNTTRETSALKKKKKERIFYHLAKKSVWKAQLHVSPDNGAFKADRIIKSQALWHLTWIVFTVGIFKSYSRISTGVANNTDIDSVSLMCFSGRQFKVRHLWHLCFSFLRPFHCEHYKCICWSIFPPHHDQTSLERANLWNKQTWSRFRSHPVWAALAALGSARQR